MGGGLNVVKDYDNCHSRTTVDPFADEELAIMEKELEGALHSYYGDKIPTGHGENLGAAAAGAGYSAPRDASANVRNKGIVTNLLNSSTNSLSSLVGSHKANRPSVLKKRNSVPASPLQSSRSLNRSPQKVVAEKQTISEAFKRKEEERLRRLDELLRSTDREFSIIQAKKDDAEDTQREIEVLTGIKMEHEAMTAAFPDESSAEKVERGTTGTDDMTCVSARVDSGSIHAATFGERGSYTYVPDAESVLQQAELVLIEDSWKRLKCKMSKASGDFWSVRETNDGHVRELVAGESNAKASGQYQKAEHSRSTTGTRAAPEAHSEKPADGFRQNWLSVLHDQTPLESNEKVSAKVADLRKQSEQLRALLEKSGKKPFGGELWKAG